MTETEPVSPPQINRQLERALSDADDVGLPLVREALHEPRDRWYGQLVGHAYVSLTDTRDPGIVLPAAAGVELLRGYVRLRSRLLVTLADNCALSLVLEPTQALLASDYLYTAAFSSLCSVPATLSNDCFEILITVLETSTEAFARIYTPAGSADHDPAMFFDETVGSLGKGAAVLGATLAGVDEPNRQHFQRLGHGLSTIRQIDRILEVNPSEMIVIPPTFNESQLRTHVQQRQDDVDQALNALSETADVTGLRTFAEADADATKEN